jgi:chaperonin GroES
MATRARPIHDRIIVRPDVPVTHTEGGIFLPPQARVKNMCGEVVASGPGFYDKKGRLNPNTVKPGDRVMFGNYAGVEIEIDGDKFQIMREGDVVGIVEGDGDVTGSDSGYPASGQISGHYQ